MKRNRFLFYVTIIDNDWLFPIKIKKSIHNILMILSSNWIKTIFLKFVCAEIQNNVHKGGASWCGFGSI